jgi:hypothetical protein
MRKQVELPLTPKQKVVVDFNLDFDTDLHPKISNISIHSNYHHDWPRNPTIVFFEGEQRFESHYANEDGKNIVERSDDNISRELIRLINELMDRETPRFEK